MLSRLGDLGEDAGEKLEDVEGLALGVARERFVVRSLSSIEEGLRARAQWIRSKETGPRKT